ncbi:MAG: hypothetical protein HC918_05215 [Oscillatoriales cyanobacterium SM2_1_8]|nr:hypothetical protein [Oscillatoriales cyanobacterium SM2_1_8]
MAIVPLRAWYVPEYEPVAVLERRPHDLRLAKNSLLKSALRADFLDESAAVRQSLWFERYLSGETVEFYIEGSGSYVVANLNLISHEIYFTKQDSLAHFDPVILFSYQNQRPAVSNTLRELLETSLVELNQGARIPLTLELTHRSDDAPLKLKSALMNRLRRCLLLVADVTPLLDWDSDPPLPLPSPIVCVEMGYALCVKRSEQIVPVQVGTAAGMFPFDLPVHDRLADTAENLTRRLPECCGSGWPGSTL